MGNVIVAASNSNILAEVFTISSSFVANEWIMDYGCSFHICPNIKWFQKFCNRETGTVYMGNNHSCSVQDVGDISLKMHDNKIRMLIDIRYVIGLKRNIISLDTLDELGFSYKVENSFMHIFKNDDLILTCTKKYGLYVSNDCCQLSVNISSTCMVKFDKTNLCHLRFGHMRQKVLQALSKQGYIGLVSIDSLDFCEPCTLGK